MQCSESVGSWPEPKDSFFFLNFWRESSSLGTSNASSFFGGSLAVGAVFPLGTSSRSSFSPGH